MKCVETGRDRLLVFPDTVPSSLRKSAYFCAQPSHDLRFVLLYFIVSARTVAVTVHVSRAFDSLTSIPRSLCGGPRSRASVLPSAMLCTAAKLLREASKAGERSAPRAVHAELLRGKVRRSGSSQRPPAEAQRPSNPRDRAVRRPAQDPRSYSTSGAEQRASHERQWDGDRQSSHERASSSSGPSSQENSRWERLWWFVRAAACIHAFREYVAEITLPVGLSMYPTFATGGEVALLDHISPLVPGGLGVGDVVIARSVQNPRHFVIKRILGMPGDDVSVPPDRHSGVLDGQGAGVTARVPHGHVWLQGDNFYNSLDSRSYGPVPLALVKGRVCAKVRPLAWDRAWIAAWRLALAWQLRRSRFFILCFFRSLADLAAVESEMDTEGDSRPHVCVQATAPMTIS